MREYFAKISDAFAAGGLPAPKMDGQGGKMLFFSGGTALKGLSGEMARRGYNSTHIVSTFDSGGSTAEIRRAFRTPAIGDIRQRISSLAGLDEDSFFERRIGPDGMDELRRAIGGAYGISKEFAELLDFFCRIMPPDFVLQGAPLGNLIIAADYLKNGRSLYESSMRISSLLGAAGIVLPVSEDFVHLAVRLDSGEILLGQHRFTGKGECRERFCIREMFFCRDFSDPSPVAVAPARDVLAQIAASGLICYPVGSFYSSVLANLRVSGVGGAVRQSRAVKVYMPNPGPDAESAHLSLEEQLCELYSAVAAGAEAPLSEAIGVLLVDSGNGAYNGGIPYAWCRANSVKIVDIDFVELHPAGIRAICPAKSALVLSAFSSLPGTVSE